MLKEEFPGGLLSHKLDENILTLAFHSYIALAFDVDNCINVYEFELIKLSPQLENLWILETNDETFEFEIEEQKAIFTSLFEKSEKLIIPFKSIKQYFRYYTESEIDNLLTYFSTNHRKKTELWLHSTLEAIRKHYTHYNIKK